MKILELDEIIAIINKADPKGLLSCIEAAFVAYSNGSAKVPPVGHLGFTDPPGDVHIKYGYIEGQPNYVVKIASGFYQNQAIGLPNNNGMMLVFNAHTGATECILLDQGYLTDLRTAIAGAVTTQHMAPKEVKAIGIIGTGVQARMQLEQLAWVTDCREVHVVGRSEEKALAYKDDMTAKGFNVHVRDSAKAVAQHSNLIVTTTASNQALLKASDIQPGTHITAMGADAPGKQELDPEILAMAELIACDSKSQCIDHGEISTALKTGTIETQNLLEIGALITKPPVRSEEGITVADLTGIATQDIAIATFVLNHYK